ncbi:HET-domain-containing protein [Xylariaceae sp. FL1272]|nr:HET-domain-containing protein [Xylariaceae sp. FL1272]
MAQHATHIAKAGDALSLKAFRVCFDTLIASSNMDIYEYTPLDDPSTAIRLLALLPGQGDEPLRGRLRHEILVAPLGDTSESKGKELKNIRKTLTAGWRAHETLDEKIIYHNDEDDSTSWIHPDPGFSPSKYDSCPNSQHTSTNPLYEALSYTWGSTQKIAAISIDDGAKSRKLPIAKNLFVALCHLRHRDEERTLWVDAICIDQENAPERGQQVQRIGEIFSLADEVIIWLGPSFEDSHLAIATVKDLGELVIFTLDDWYFWKPGYNGDRTVLHQIDGRNLHPESLSALRKLYASPYFTRLWVVQEVHAGCRKVVVRCGNDEVPWTVFRYGSNALNQGLQLNACRGVFPTYDVEYFCDPIRNCTTVDVMRRYAIRECTDNRDRVYGLMKLLPPTVRRSISVDYDNTDYRAVFTDLFLVCLKQEQRLSQLAYGCGSSNDAISSQAQSSEWPSWLPNWSYESDPSWFAYLGFGCSSFSAAQAEYREPGYLGVIGIKLATVCEVQDELGQYSSVEDLVKLLNGQGLDRLKETRYPTGGTLLDAYLHCCVTDRFEDSFPSKNWGSYQNFKDNIIKFASMHESEANYPFLYNSVSLQISRAALEMEFMSLFTLSNKFLGVSNRQASQGDEVFVILGCELPMILRPLPHKQQFRVVGPCYVHGMMHGEALLGSLKHPWLVKVPGDEDGQDRAHFKNTETDLSTHEDPRLAEIPIPEEWEPIEFEWTTADPLYTKKFRNKNTGEVINSDPRLSPEALRERGIELETITLV